MALLAMKAPTLNDVLEIPGNKSVYAQFRGRLTEKTLSAFIGAGVSAPLYPLWKELIDGLAEEAVRHGVAKNADKAYWVRNAGAKPLHVSAQIRAKLGEPRWHPFLYETFKDRIGNDGRTYTPAQASLAKLSLKAILTTNYDPGIVEARRETQPGLRQTGFLIWNQSFAIQKWASGDLFREQSGSPILYAHGHFADPESIVLDYNSYQRAYHNTP